MPHSSEVEDTNLQSWSSLKLLLLARSRHSCAAAASPLLCTKQTPHVLGNVLLRVRNPQLLFQHQVVFTAGDGLFQPQQLHDQVISVRLETSPSSRKLLYVLKRNFRAGSGGLCVQDRAVPRRQHGAVVLPILALSWRLFSAFLCISSKIFGARCVAFTCAARFFLTLQLGCSVPAAAALVPFRFGLVLRFFCAGRVTRYRFLRSRRLLLRWLLKHQNARD